MSNDDLDINLEPTVLLILSRLQKGNRGNKKQQNAAGVSCKKIVELLKANCPWVDGDVESQVMTALLSCVKAGIVCSLDNQKFLLIKAAAKKMISNCVTRVSHGPKCCCLPMLKSLLKTPPRVCCYIKKPDPPAKKLKKSPNRVAKPKSVSSPRRKKKSSNTPGKKCQKNCAQNAQNQIGTSKSALSISHNPCGKCNYCMEIHSLPKLRKLCMTCYPIGKFNAVPPDKFSPRDELTPAAETVVANVVENVAENTPK